MGDYCAAVLTIVGALGVTGPTEAAETLTAAQEEKVLDGLRKILKDPNSATLGQIEAGPEESGTIYICGFVNAKNLFGGYTGDKPFIGMLFPPPPPPTDAFIALGIGGTESDSIGLNNTCKSHGLGLWCAE